MDDTFDEYFTRANPDPQPKEETWDSTMSSFIPLRNSERDRKLHDVSSLIGTMRVDMAKPNTQLTDHHNTQAKLANSASKSFLEGVDEAQIYLNHEGIDKTIVDSSRYGIMLRDNETGKYTLALRGMRIDNPRDIWNASQLASGTNESKRIAIEMIDRVEAGGGQVERVVGHSMGGSDTMDISWERGIPGTAFDAPVSPRMVLKNTLSTSAPKADLELIRNPENILSIGTGFRNVSVNPQYRVSTVPTKKGGMLFENHELVPNFTKTQLDSAQAEAELLVRVGTRFAQHETMIDMTEAMANGQSFTEFQRDLNSQGGRPSGVDVDIDGIFNKLGPRVNKNAPLIKLWEQLGGEFNTDEITHLNNTEAGSPGQSIIADTDIVEHLKNGEIDSAKNKATERFSNGMNALAENEVMSHPAVKNAVAEHLRNAIHPTTMATGMISMFAGDEIMSIIDPSGDFNQGNEAGILEHSAVSGAITGGIGDVLINGLSGGTSLFSKSIGSVSVATGAGAVAGTATQYAVDKALDKAGANEDTKESLGDISGGLVGGATTAVVADVSAIAYATMVGAEVGELGGPLTALAGAGIGATFGALSYGLGKLQQVPSVKKAEKKVGRFFKKLF